MLGVNESECDDIEVEHPEDAADAVYEIETSTRRGDPIEEAECYGRGESYERYEMDSSHPDNVVIRLESAIKLNPKSPHIKIWKNELVRAYFELEDYEKVLELEPRNTEAHLLLGTEHYRKGDYERAVECYEWVINGMKPDYEKACREMKAACLGLETFWKLKGNEVKAEEYRKKAENISLPDHNLTATGETL